MELAVGVAGAAIGYGGWGTIAAAQVGWTVAVTAYSLLGPKPKGPGPGDLTTPKLNLGAQIPRPYGTVRLAVNPIWIPDQYRATAHEAEGGKGAPDGPVSYTYDTDMLGLVCDGTRVVGVTREWWDKKLIYTALATSSPESLAASKSTPNFASVSEFFGGPDQMPWSVYEDYKGAGNTPANRGMFTRGYAGLQCGSSKTLPMIEVEVITQGTPDPSGVFWLINANGAPGSTTVNDDSSYGYPVALHNMQQVAPGFYGSGTMLSSNALTIDKAYVESENVDFPWTAHDDLCLEGKAHLERDFNMTIIVLQAGSNDNPISCGVGSSGRLFLRVFGEIAYTPANDESQGTGTHHWELDYNGSEKSACLFLDGVLVLSHMFTGTVPSIAEVSLCRALFQDSNVASADAADFQIDGIRFSNRLRNTSAFTPPTSEPTDDLGGAWTPGIEYLDDVILAELAQHPNFDPADVDVSDIADIEVRGYVAIGPPEQTIAELCDMFYVGVVPGNPIKFIKRGKSAVATIPWRATGAGVGEPGEPFDGLNRMGNDEVPGVKAIAYPDLNRDHNPGLERGDRLTTEGPDVRRVDTRVVFTADEAKARAISASLLERMSRNTSEFGLSDFYAEAEPEDVYVTTDRGGNTYRQRIKSFTYADGVRRISWELDDPNSYLKSAAADMSDEPTVEVAITGEADWQAMDLPQLRDADNSPGYYLAVKTTDESVAYGYESADGTGYISVQRFELDAVFGPVTAIGGTLRASNLFDESVSITVNVGQGTLATATRESLFADRNLNAFAIVSPAGVCKVVGQFRSAAVQSEGVYLLTGLLLDRWEDARFVSDVAASDVFCLLRSTGGMARLSRSTAQLGVPHFVKAVAMPRIAASVDGVQFLAAGVSLLPPAPIQLRKTLDASTGDATYTFNRCTRMETRFGGDLGDSVPLGETTEAYRITFYTDGTYAAVQRAFDVTTAAFNYSAADRTTDYGSSTATAYVGIAQISATVGAGFELRTTA